MCTVQFYYSIGSRYSYLASSQIASLQRETGCRIEWCPINSRRLLSLRGQDPHSEPSISGQYDWAYRKLDAGRWAALYGIPFIEPRGRVEFDSQLLALAAVAAKRLGHVESYSHELFSAMFAESSIRAIDRGECFRRAARCSLRESEFQSALDDPATVEMLSTTLDVAHHIGVFGVPTFAVGPELFWGNDRLVLLRHHLCRSHLPR